MSQWRWNRWIAVGAAVVLVAAAAVTVVLLRSHSSSPPTFTTSARATFTTAKSTDFTVRASGSPTPTITLLGDPLAGVTLVDKGGGRATLSGIPTVPPGRYVLTLEATSSAGSATQALSVTVTQPPAFTSPATATFTVTGVTTFTVKADGSPVPSIAVTADPLVGVSFVDNHDGTATLSGTPTVTPGSYTVTLVAANVAGSATQTLAVVVEQGPAVTSAATATAVVGQPSSFTITTSGFPLPTLALSGPTPPAGMTFVDNGNGTATLSGTPPAGTAGRYALKVTATNAAGSATQTLVLLVTQGPAFTSPATATFSTTKAVTIKVTATGTPAPAIALTAGALAGVTLVDHGNGTATLSGIPTVAPGPYVMTLTATNGAGSATQTLAVVVEQEPTVTSAATTTADVGQPSTFTVTTGGFPPPALTVSKGTVPSGITFVDNGNGTATLSGTPAAGTAKTYALGITAKNAAGSVTQTFSLVVTQPPAFTSAGTVTFSAAKSNTFKVSASGSPAPSLTLTAGQLPGLTFVDKGKGTATLSGTPGVAPGKYVVTLVATNAGGSVTQTLTVTVDG